MFASHAAGAGFSPNLTDSPAAFEVVKSLVWRSMSRMIDPALIELVVDLAVELRAGLAAQVEADRGRQIVPFGRGRHLADHVAVMITLWNDPGFPSIIAAAGSEREWERTHRRDDE
jgi:hypothetical protein